MDIMKRAWKYEKQGTMREEEGEEGDGPRVAFVNSGRQGDRHA